MGRGWRRGRGWLLPTVTAWSRSYSGRDGSLEWRVVSVHTNITVQGPPKHPPLPFYPVVVLIISSAGHRALRGRYVVGPLTMRRKAEAGVSLGRDRQFARRTDIRLVSPASSALVSATAGGGGPTSFPLSRLTDPAVKHLHASSHRVLRNQRSRPLSRQPRPPPLAGTSSPQHH